MNIIDHVTLDGVTRYIKDSAGQAMIAPEEASTTAANAYAVGEVFRLDGKLYKATAAITAGDTIVAEGNGANCQETKITEVYVKNTDYATSSAPGIVQISKNDGIGISSSAHTLYINAATSALVKAGTDEKRPIVPSNQHEAVFYGLAKAAGYDEKNSEELVGTYSTSASAAIRSMLDAVGNEEYATSSKLGLVKVKTGYGIRLDSVDRGMSIIKASSNEIKIGTNVYKPIVPYNQHESVFYALATASGDTTQSASSNAIGQYTDSAKASIKSMLGIIDGSTGTVDITGTTPTITAVENTRYVCGEITTLSFTPSASGICIVRFTSGSTPTVVTIPNTVKFPEWFDITALEADTIYEICVTDGIYGAVMSWAL